MLTHSEGLLAFVFFTAVIAVYGLVEIIAPAKLMELQDWIGQTDRWSRRNKEWKRNYWQHRIAGILAILLAGWMVWSTISPIQQPKAGTGTPSVKSGLQTRSGWLGLVIAVVLISGGFYFLAEPEKLFRWVTSGRPDRILSQESLRKGVLKTRIFAGLIVLFGISALFFWMSK